MRTPILTIPSFFIQQATFCVNSLAHWLGDQPFDDRNSPRDHVITALVTLGEGYHKYVHMLLDNRLRTSN
jgi:stearoyl-CoA desaturase (delta-9 desaturase)